MLKAAVIGVGSIGQNHARVYRDLDGVQLVGVADAFPATAAKIGNRLNVPFYSDIDKMLDEQKPDLVSISVPTSLHFDVGMKIIGRGLHLLVEKPITSTVEQAEELCEAAKKKGVLLAVGHIERFNPAAMELRRRLREGMAGRIYKIHTQRLSPYPSRIQDAGVVIDLASHDIDLMRYLMGEEVLRVYGETLQSINSDREDMFNGLMRFKNGTVGVLDVNWMTPTKIRRLTVTGARGMFDCNLLSQELFFYENETAPSQWDTLSVLRGVSEGNVLGIRLSRHEPLSAELSDFAAAVRDGRSPTVTGQDGLETLRLALDFVRSGKDVAVVNEVTALP
ncbi:MAG: Gfo/Idh/MocA family oxidoreductase [Anaerolineae bacterium]|nr:Gfo/Idh/MocA family oxidoreductase [Anaerolineae bacterium]MBN8619237.1 Gfo/Idh/MocA family oxidoreductase [Anaerolineae bacterium]